MATSFLFTGARNALRRIETVAAWKALPRLLVTGTAGSGKSAVLREFREKLLAGGLPVRVLDVDADILKVPPNEVLFVDDLHLLKPEQIEAVLVRAGNPDAGLVAARRPWPRTRELTDIERLLQRSAPPIILGQVLRAEVLAYLASEGTTVPEACIDELLAVAGGAAWVVTYALSNSHSEDCNGGDEHLELRRDLEDQVLHRLGTLEAPLRRMIERLSLGSLGERAFSEDDSDASDELIAQGYAEGLLLRSGSPLPIVRSAVRTSVSLRWKAANGDVLAAGIAQAAGDDDGSYEELIDGIRDPRVGAALVARGDLVLESDPERAGALYRVALVTGADPSDLVLRRAQAAWATGDLDAAAEFIDTALQDERYRDDDWIVNAAAAMWTARGMMPTACEVYPANRPMDEIATGLARIVHIGSGNAVPSNDSTGVSDGSPPSTLRIALRLLDRGLQASLKGNPGGEALSDLVRASELYTASGVTSPIPELPAVIAASAAIGSGDVVWAGKILEAAVAGNQGGRWARRRLLLWQALVAIQGERPADARRALAEAEKLTLPMSPRDAALDQTVRVTLTRRYEDLNALEVAWANAGEVTSNGDIDLYMVFPLAALIGAAARLGDSTTLAPHLRGGLGLLKRLGSPPLWSTQLWWAGIQQGILLGRPDSLAPYAKALVRAAEHSPVAATMAKAGGVWVSVLAGNVDGGAVEEAARSLGAAGLAWDGARLAGHGSSRTDDRRVATRLLSCARDLHPKDSAQSSAPAVGGETKPSASTANAEALLSEREFEVARLILRGKTYNEIGEALFISPRTVEHHVAHMRRRLTATSRSDLISKLRLVIDPPDDAAAPKSGKPRGESRSARVRV
ncbi:MAG TPA: helix-turn-helix transcriptional regulator [Actinomycetaceae bacterium]|nr:helix-turn-helix transcriptional regulator [Actinomycetaceae bacterium]